ncbi:hypothetical protein [Flavobacterium sp. FlaQc-30]|uniref:hypothetical protein n=1 Tax=Flavobacterium sp. FlaQc-30 TaxID=3374179 RepID=UPI003757EDEF
MKYVILTLLVVNSFSINGQEVTDHSQILKEFYFDLYADNITPEEIVSEYILYSDASQYKKAIDMVLDFRNLAIEENEHFGLLKKDIKENNFSISAYSYFDESDKVKFTEVAKEKRNNIYKVTLKNTIPQYVLLENNKIVSFFGFQKAGSNEYYFVGFQ